MSSSLFCPKCKCNLTDKGVGEIELRYRDYWLSNDSGIIIDKDEIGEQITSLNVFECRSCQCDLSIVWENGKISICPIEEKIELSVDMLDIILSSDVSVEARRKIIEILKLDKALNNLEKDNDR